MVFGYWSCLDKGLGDDEEDPLEPCKCYHFIDRKGKKLANSMCSKRFKTTFRMSIDTFDGLGFTWPNPLIEGIGSSNGMSIEPREKMQIFCPFVDLAYSTTKWWIHLELALSQLVI